MYTLIPIVLLISATLAQDDVTTELSRGTNSGPVEDEAGCLTARQEAGKCVPFYLCNDTATNSEELGLIDIHYPIPEDCPAYLDVCCKSALIRDPIDLIRSSRSEPEKSEKREGCGWVSTTSDILDLDPTVAKFGEFPWVVAILDIDDKKNTKYIGSGTLIDRRVVLTAAHSVVKAKKLRVRAGEWDSQTEKEIYSHQDRDVESVVVHKDFISKTLYYDAALLFLSEPFDLAPHIGIACLPQFKEKAEPETDCTVAGWGKEFGKEGPYQTILSKAAMKVVAHGTCQDDLRKTRLGNNFELHHTFMCARGDKNRDTCKGNEGSVLMCPVVEEPGSRRYVVNGMAAWSIIRCSASDTPSAFVDVAELRDWIDNQVLGKGIEDLEYAKY